MYQILKIFGVSADVLPRLHQVLNGPEVKSKNRVWQTTYSGGSGGNVSFAELLSSKYDSDKGTYTLEIKVHMRVECSDYYKDNHANYPIMLLPPLSVLTAIYKALGEDLFPEEEKTIDMR